jgi:hypothetical protein
MMTPRAWAGVVSELTAIGPRRAGCWSDIGDTAPDSLLCPEPRYLFLCDLEKIPLFDA